MARMRCARADTARRVGAGSHAALERLRAEWKGRVEIQTVSLCNFTEYFGGGADRVLELTAKYKATAMGGFPQPNPDLPRQLDSLMAAAREPASGSTSGIAGRADWPAPNARAPPRKRSCGTSSPTPSPADTIACCPCKRPSARRRPSRS